MCAIAWNAEAPMATSLDGLASQDLQARAGLHVGEIELQGDDIAGLAVHVAARVMGRAGEGEVLVSRTVRSRDPTDDGPRSEDRGPPESSPARAGLLVADEDVDP